MNIEQRFRQIIAKSRHVDLIELGACDGYHSRVLYEIASSDGRTVKMTSLEPVPDLVKAINAKMDGKLGFTCIEAAIAEKDEKRTLHLSGGKYYGSSSICKPKACLNAWPDMKFEEIQIQCLSLETILKDYTKVDFIWADIQGAEREMIKGGEQALHDKVRFLYTEYCDGELYEGEPPLREIASLLHGWELVQDYDGDALFRNTRI